jgi:hypothetical protein
LRGCPEIVAGKQSLGYRFRISATTARGKTWWLPFTTESAQTAEAATGVRVAHRLRTPKALQAATAIRAQATGLVTNDLVFERMAAFETLALDHLL